MAIFDGQDMVFDDFNFADYFYVENVRRPLLPPIENYYTPTGEQTYHRKARRGVYTLEIDIRLIRKERLDVIELKRMLAGKLYKDKPCKLFARGDWRFDMAILDGEVNFEQLHRTGFATLTFLVFGPSFGKFREPIVRDIAHNTGTAQTWPVIKINPDSQQPRIVVENRTTGEKITIDRVIPAGSTVQIGRYTDDMSYEQIVLLDGSSIMGSLWYDSEFPRLKPGDNAFTITGAPSAQMTYWERWL